MKFKDIKFDVKQISSEGQFEGYAAVFNNLDLGGDIIMPGAFTKTISESAVHSLLWHHHPDLPIGITKAAEDSKGLAVEGNLNLNVEKAREVHSLMKQGAVKGLSFGYDTVGPKETKGRANILRELKLYEVSLVSVPMNPEAQVTAIKSAEDFEQLLQELISFKSTQPLSAEHKALIEQAQKQLSALQAADSAPEAATHDNNAPEILHARLSTLETLLRGESRGN